MGKVFFLCAWLQWSALSFSIWAQQSLYWDMQQSTPVSTMATLQVSSLEQGNNYGNTSFFTTLSVSQNYTGASGGNNAGLAARPGALSIASSGSAYIGVSLTPPSGFRIRLLSIAFGSRSTASGPTRWGLFSSADQFTNPHHTATMQANSTWSWQQSPSLSLLATQPLALRIYGYEGTGAAAINIANWRIDDLTIHYQLEAISLPVSWLYVRAASSQYGVHLRWATANEINNKEFQIERSTDGIFFVSVAKVEPAQIDSDGAFSYSVVLSVSYIPFLLTPNIRQLYFDRAAQRLEVLITGTAGCKQLALYNAMGQLVKRQNVVAVMMDAGVGCRIGTMGLPAGIYYLVVSADGQRSEGKAVQLY
ncbi:MAG: T9SS C-terminal target domain-containing protein [Chitinophagia bacterium]|nr:T9SS C-terminal target domain-containing protein [Chitinophagia bacterium]